MKRSIFASLGDTHGNSKVGLLNPEATLHEEVPLFEEDDEEDEVELIPYTPTLTLAQKRLWGDYTEDLTALAEVAAGDPVDVLHGGDLAQGSKHWGELVSTRAADMIEIAAANLRPILDLKESGKLNLRNFWIAKGTGAHTEGEGSLELVVAKLLSAEYDFKVKVAYHYLLDIDGYMVDASHHGPGPGIRNWLRGNILQLYTLSLMMDELDAGRRPPDLVIRHHFHQYVRRWSTKITHRGTFETLAVICPSYCFTNDYARKVAKSPSRITIGQLAYELLDGKLYYTHELLRTYDLRVKEIVRSADLEMETGNV